MRDSRGVTTALPAVARISRPEAALPRDTPSRQGSLSPGILRAPWECLSETTGWPFHPRALSSLWGPSHPREPRLSQSSPNWQTHPRVPRLTREMMARPGPCAPGAVPSHHWGFSLLRAGPARAQPLAQTPSTSAPRSGDATGRSSSPRLRSCRWGPGGGPGQGSPDTLL